MFVFVYCGGSGRVYVVCRVQLLLTLSVEYESGVREKGRVGQAEGGLIWRQAEAVTGSMGE